MAMPTNTTRCLRAAGSARRWCGCRDGNRGQGRDRYRRSRSKSKAAEVGVRPTRDGVAGAPEIDSSEAEGQTVMIRGSDGADCQGENHDEKHSDTAAGVRV